MLRSDFNLDRNVVLATVLLNRPLSEKEFVALEDVHDPNLFFENSVALPEGYGSYSAAQLKILFSRLTEDYSWEDSDRLIRFGLAGWKTIRRTNGTISYLKDSSGFGIPQYDRNLVNGRYFKNGAQMVARGMKSSQQTEEYLRQLKLNAPRERALRFNAVINRSRR